MKEVCSFYLTWVIKIIENLLWRLSTLKARAIWGALIASSYWSSMTTNEFFSIVEKNFVEGSPSEINKPNINYIFIFNLFHLYNVRLRPVFLCATPFFLFARLCIHSNKRF